MNSSSERGNERERMMALFRYSIISPVLNPNDPRSLKTRLQEQASKIWMLPDGVTQKVYSWMTLEEWYYLYKNHGFEILVRQKRSDRGSFSSISDKLKEFITNILEKYPTLKYSNLIPFLHASPELQDEKFPGKTTLYRYLKFIGEKQTTPGQERRAFEVDHINDLWQTDIMYGPYIPVRQKNGKYPKRQTYLIAIIDDHSRRLVQAEFYLEQTLEDYMDSLKKAFLKCGVPVRIYCDNGKVFRSMQIRRIAAEVGTAISHTKVRDAAAKGKIERFFRTVRDQFINGELLMSKAKNIDDLNSRFAAYLHVYNNRRHSAIGESPMNRWLAGSQYVRPLPPKINFDNTFLLETERLVKKDGTFSINTILFETDWTLAGKKVQLRYSLRDLSRVQVYYDGEFIGTSLPLNRDINNGLPRHRAKKTKNDHREKPND